MTVENNPLLARIRLPGEIHALPSRGLFYKNNELDPSVKNGELHIHAMTTYEEIVMRSPDMLYSGDAVRTVISRCIPQVLKPEKLLAKDVDFLMLTLRKASYGPHFEIQYTHTCEKAKSHSYIVDLDDVIRKTRAIDPVSFAKMYSVKLPNQQLVKLEPVRYEGIVRLLQASEVEHSPEKRRDMFTSILLDWIQSVDEVTDKAMIKTWLESIPVGFAKEIESSIDATHKNWGADFQTKITCRDCGQPIDVSSPINPLTFFM